MHTCIKSLFLAVILLWGMALFSQQPCKVLVKEISDQYIGKCKKGLAHGNGKASGMDTYEGRFRKGLPHGKGTYTWANGDMYEGDWKEGVREGFGILKFTIEDKDSLLVGMWERDEYIGPKPEKPKVIASDGVERFSFRRLGDGDRFTINFYMNGTVNSSIEALSAISTSGAQFNTGVSIGYDALNWPVNCKVTYVTWNKTHTRQYRVRFEFEISQPGNWEINLHN